MQQLPSSLTTPIEDLVKNLKLAEEAKGGKVGQGSSPGKGVISPKIDPVVGVRYLFIPRAFTPGYSNLEFT